MNFPEEPGTLVSIIIAVFNSKATLQQCIDSITQQTYPNKELIIVDGGSTDGTVNVLRENAEKISTWISEPDHGIYNAWNKGLAMAHGKWICFLGADDFLWDETVLERMAQSLQTLPQSIRVAYAQIMLIDVNGQSLRTIGQPWGEVRESFKQFMCIPHVGTMHRRELFEQNGKFDESFQIAGDYELLLRELKNADAKFIPDFIFAGQRLGGISTHEKNNLKIKREVWRAQRMHELPMQWRPMFREIANEYLRLALCKVLGKQPASKLIALCTRAKHQSH